MNKTQISFNREAREKVLKGVNIMADAVGSTLGARGQNVAIAKTTPQGQVYERIVLHDGVSVARAIELEDETENMGAQLLKQAAQKQVDEVGDGTTAVMLLAQAIINESHTLIASGVNPMSLRKGLESAADDLTSELERMAKPVRGLKDLKYIATISAEDPELGGLVAETYHKLSKDGVITVEESKSSETLVEHQEGMQLDKGYMHPWFVTNPERMEAILENPYFLITDKSITSLNEFAGFFEQFTKLSRTLVIISPDISGEALPLLIQNKLQGKLAILGIQAPSFGDDQKNILQDIAILTGGKFISTDAGYKFEDLTTDDLGFAEYISATKDETIIVGGRGKKTDVEKRIASIRKTLEHEEGEFDKQRLRSRLGKLTNGVAVIRVGGRTEVEMKERRERALDSVAATHAAMEKGIIPGGEVAYLKVRKILERTQKDVAGLKAVGVKGFSENNLITDKILFKALGRPFQKLLSNADISEVSAALALVGKGEDWGIDVTDGQAKDMVKAGIVDPVLVPIHALQNAVSVAVQIMTTNTVIVPLEKKEHSTV